MNDRRESPAHTGAEQEPDRGARAAVDPLLPRSSTAGTHPARSRTCAPRDEAPSEICRASAFGMDPALAAATGEMHAWIRQGDLEAGRGPSTSSLNPVDVAVVDHTGLGDVVTTACVDRELRRGRDLCLDTVEDILRTGSHEIASPTATGLR